MESAEGVKRGGGNCDGGAGGASGGDGQAGTVGRQTRPRRASSTAVRRDMTKHLQWLLSIHQQVEAVECGAGGVLYIFISTRERPCLLTSGCRCESERHERPAVRQASRSLHTCILYFRAANTLLPHIRQSSCGCMMQRLVTALALFPTRAIGSALGFAVVPPGHSSLMHSPPGILAATPLSPHLVPCDAPRVVCQSWKAPFVRARSPHPGRH